MRLSAHRRRGGRAFLWLLIGLLAGAGAGAGAVYLMDRGKAGIPGGPRLGEAKELALVPADAVGFVHFRARDAWHSPHLAEFRKLVLRAGPDALDALDANFVPAPSSLDRVTLVLMHDPKAVRPEPPKFGGGKLPPTPKPLIDGPVKVEPVGVLAFTKPFDADKVRNALMPGAVAKKAGAREYWEAPAGDLAAYFPSDTVLVVGSAVGVTQFVTKQTADGSPPEGPLARAAAQAGRGGRHFAAAVNMKHLTINLDALKREVGGVGDAELIQLAKDAAPLLAAEAVGIGFALGDEESKLDIRAYFKDDAAADAGEKAVRAVAAFARKKLEEPRKEMEQAVKGPPGQPKPFPINVLPQAAMSLVGLGALNSIDDTLANPPLTREGAELVATFDQPMGGSAAVVGVAAVGVGLLLPAVQKVRDAAGRMSSSNNLKQIGLTMLNYESTYGRLPAPAWTQGAAATKPGGLSWRVHMLPYLEQDQLYKQFKLDEPWDGPNNKKLIEQMPKVYASPTAPAEPGKTYYKVFVGRDTMFPPGGGLTLVSITDGTSNTVMAVEGGAAVTWTKPDDIPFTGNIDPKALYLNGNPRINVAMGDGSVRSIDLSRVSPKTLNAAITPAGGEILGDDW